MNIRLRIFSWVWKFLPSLKERIYGSIDGYSTHGPILLNAINYLLVMAAPDQRVVLLEFGIGGESTRILTSYVKMDSRIVLYSFENNLEWYTNYKSLYAADSRSVLTFIPGEDGYKEVSWSKLETEVQDDLVLSFIDSSPWETRIECLSRVSSFSDLVLIHDVDYFPRNQIFGKQISPIKFRPILPFRYGKLRRKNLGSRVYDDLFRSWAEFFPKRPAYFPGPPTLLGSNLLNISNVKKPRSMLRVPRISSGPSQ